MKTLTAQQLKQKRKQGENFTLINTLSHENFEKTHIPHSINIPLENGNFPQNVENAVGGKDQPVVVYCASAECQSSSRAAKELEQADFTQVYDFEGGAKEWQQAGEALVGQN